MYNEKMAAALAAVRRAEEAQGKVTAFIQWCLNEEARQALSEFRMVAELRRAGMSV